MLWMSSLPCQPAAPARASALRLSNSSPMRLISDGSQTFFCMSWSMYGRTMLWFCAMSISFLP